MEVRRVLQGHWVVQHYRKEDDQDEEPHAVNSKLVGGHEVLPNIHWLHIKQSHGVHAWDLEVPKVEELVAPDLPNDQGHQEKCNKVTDDQIEEIGSRDSNDLEKQGHAPGHLGELDDHEHVHEDQCWVENLGHIVVIAEVEWIYEFALAKQVVHVTA